MHQISKIYFVIKLFMFRATSVPIIRSYRLYARQLVCFTQVTWPLRSRDRLELCSNLSLLGYLMHLVSCFIRSFVQHGLTEILLGDGATGKRLLLCIVVYVWCVMVCTMAQAFSSHPVTAGPQVWPQVSPFGIFDGQISTGTGCCTRTVVVSCPHHSTSALYHSLIHLYSYIRMSLMIQQLSSWQCH